MASNTVWLMDDEEQWLELHEAYQEARAQIDRRIPRGERQTEWAYRKMRDRAWCTRWLLAHQFAGALAATALGDPHD